MTVEERSFPDVNWENFLRQSNNSANAAHYFDKKEWFTELYVEKYINGTHHHVEFSATINYLAKKKIDVITAMKNGTFRHYRENYTVTKWHYKDFDGKILVSVSIVVVKDDIIAKLKFPDGRQGKHFIASLSKSKSWLTSIVDKFKDNFTEFFNDLLSKESIWESAMGEHSIENSSIDKKSGQSATVHIREGRPISITHGATNPVEKNIQLLDFPLMLNGKRYGTVGIFQTTHGEFWVVYFDLADKEMNRESIGKFEKDDSPAKQIEEKETSVEKFLYEYEATLNTLRTFPPAENMMLHAFFVSRRRFLVKSVTCVDKNLREYLTYELWAEDYNFKVKYIRQGKPTLIEHVSNFAIRGPETIKTLCDEFEVEFETIFQRCEAKFPGKTRAEIYEEQHYHKERYRVYITKFAQAIQQYLDMYFLLNEHRVKDKEIDPADYKPVMTVSEDGNSVDLNDWDIPPRVVLTGTIYRNRFFKSSQTTPLPTITAVENAYRRLVTLRQRRMDVIRDFAFVRSYTLRKVKELAAIKIEGSLEIVNSELFQAAKKIPDKNYHLSQMDITITEELIEKLIEEGSLSKERKEELTRRIGKKLYHQVLKSGIYGNIRRQISILKDLNEGAKASEVSEVKEVVGFLQSKRMRVRTAGDSQEDVELSDQFSSQIYYYLQGQIQYSDLQITTIAQARRAIAVVKMFDVGIHMINCSSQEKYRYERVSEDLKTKVLEQFPDIRTHEAFTRLLNTDDVEKCVNALMPSRNAHHAHIASMNLLMLQWASEFLDTITGVGGNSAAGKTTYTQGKTLSYDKWRYLLRRGTEILPSQDFAECSQKYNEFLKFVIEETDLKYTLDLRFLEPKFVNDNIIKAAKLRGENIGKMIYLITPLKTSLLRMLTRTPYGTEPAQSSIVITSGYKTLHAQFQAIVDLMNKEDAISYYDIYYREGTQFIRIASKRGRIPEISDQDRFNKCKIVPDESEIKAIEETVITEEMIQEAILCRDIFAEQAVRLRTFIGQKLGDAVNKNARGGK